MRFLDLSAIDLRDFHMQNRLRLNQCVDRVGGGAQRPSIRTTDLLRNIGHYAGECRHSSAYTHGRLLARLNILSCFFFSIDKRHRPASEM